MQEDYMFAVVALHFSGPSRLYTCIGMQKRIVYPICISLNTWIHVVTYGLYPVCIHIAYYVPFEPKTRRYSYNPVWLS